MRRHLFSIAIAATLGFCSPAFAGEIQCVWDVLPKDASEKLLKAFDEGLEPEIVPIFADETVVNGVLACMPRLDSERQAEAAFKAVSLALYGSGMERAAARYLLQDDEDGAAAAALEYGWRTLSAKDRAQIGDLSNRKSATEALNGAVIAAGGAPNGDDAGDDPILVALFEYFTGRAMRELHETRF